MVRFYYSRLQSLSSQKGLSTFRVELNRNVWFDFSIGEGRYIVSFFMQYHQVKRAKALELIQDYIETLVRQVTDKNSEE